MRTLKKSLCLVLALVLVLGLCTIGSNAAYAGYTDIAQVTNDYMDAVEVLSGLDVIEGYPDGTFKPAENVTRAEAAAMITRMMLGREGADKLPIGDVKFSDVPETNWAAKYIAFCANKGIIVGMGDGTFRPSDNITGTQMAVMLLRALGYGVIGEYEGKGWDINGVADALYYGVFEDSLVTDFNNAATREETALYIWNTMWIQLVGYDVDLNYYDGKEYIDDNNRVQPLTFAKEAYDLVKLRYGQILANQATGSEYTLFRYNGRNLKLDYETGVDLIGHEVTAYCRDHSKEDAKHVQYWEAYLIKDESTTYNPGYTFATYDDVYRTLKAANKENLDLEFEDIETWTNWDYTLTGKMGTFYDYWGEKGSWGVADSDYGYTWVDLANFIFEYNMIYTSVSELKGQKSSNDLGWLYLGGTWIFDHEGKVLRVLEDEYRVGKVKNVDTDHDEVEVDVYDGDEWPEIYDFKWNDVDLVYDGIAKNDYVQIQPVGQLYYVKATSTETVDITERHSLFGWSFNNGAYSADSYGLGITIEDQDDPADVNVGDKVMFYVIKSLFGTNYFGLQILEKAKSEGIVYVNYKVEAIDLSDWDTITTKEDDVADKGKITTSYKVQCINQDGEEVVYTMYTDPEDPDAVAAFEAVQEGSVMEVFVRNGLASFEAVDEQTEFTKVIGKNSYLTDGDSIYYVTDDTKVVYFSGKGAGLSIKVTSKLADQKDDTDDYPVYAVSKKSGGNYKLTTVWVPDKKAPASYSDSIMYIKAGTFYYHSADGYELFNDDEDPYYTTYVDGVKTSAHVSGKASLFYGDSVKPGFYQFNLTKKGVYSITAVDAEDVHYDVTLIKGMVKNGRLYAENSDGVKLQVDVVDLSGDTTTQTKKDAKVNSLERLEELLSEGYTITVDYMFATDKSGNEIPTGVMYVTAVDPPAED